MKDGPFTEQNLLFVENVWLELCSKMACLEQASYCLKPKSE